MRRINRNFNASNGRSVKKLNEMLTYLSGSNEFAESDIRKYSKKTDRLVKLYASNTFTEGQLDGQTIDKINVAYVEKKYKDLQAIKQLHTNLSLLKQKGLIKVTLTPLELKAGVFGEGTVKAISEFQKRYKLEETGKINPETDEKLESVMAGVTGVKPAEKKKVTHVKTTQLRRVVKSIRMNTSGSQVRNLQMGLAKLNYTINLDEYEAMGYKESTVKAVRAFQEKNGLEVTGHVDSITAEKLNSELIKLNPKLYEDDAVRICGSAKDSKWKGLEGIKVSVYKFGYGGKETLLKEVLTFGNGFFNITLNRLKKEIDQPLNLSVKMFMNNREIFCKQYMDVKKQLWVNYTDGEDKYLGSSEYEKYMKLINRTLGKSGIVLDDLEESDTCHDLSMLSKEAEMPFERLVQMILAGKIEGIVGHSDLEASVFYGFLRLKALPGGVKLTMPETMKSWQKWMDQISEELAESIVLMDEDKQKAVLESAFTHNYIPHRLSIEV